MALPETVKTGRQVNSLSDRLTIAKDRRNEAIRERVRSGVTMAEVARETGLTRQAVKNIVSRATD